MMKIRFIFPMFLFILLGTAFKIQDCKTVFTIKDCDDNPVVGATVSIERCKDHERFTSVTDTKGQTTFPLCKEEICKTKISYVGYSVKDMAKVGDNCEGNNCTIKICSD